MKKALLLIGGGGHCKSVLDCIISLGRYDRIGVVDFEKISILGIPVIGNDSDLPALFRDGWTDAFITVGSIGKTSIRRHLYDMLKDIGFSIPIITDSTSIIAKGVEIKEGCFIGKKAIVNTGSYLGCCSIINTGAIVEHDCNIGDFAHISPGSILCGQVNVGKDSHVGAGTIVKQQITIGDNVLIGAGSVVLKNIEDYSKAFGNPCRVIE